MTKKSASGMNAVRLVFLFPILVSCSSGEASNLNRATEEELLPVAPREKGAVLHAFGFEPAWTLDIYDDRMVYVGRYGEERVVTPPPELLAETDRKAEPPERTYIAHTDTYELRVRVVEELCRKPGGGAPLELTIHLYIDGQEYQGCGRRT